MTTVDKRFFESTRGQLILLLRDGNKTVNELATWLNLTDNAVRSHLLSLERDGFVKQTGTVKGFRKPHVTYGLAEGSRELFPKAYDALLNVFLSVVKNKFSPEDLQKIMSEVGKAIGSSNAQSSGDLKSKLENAISALADLGGTAKIVEKDGKLLIKSDSCPFAESVVEHPEICNVTESMIAEITKVHVRETCERDGRPRCSFTIDTGGLVEP